MLMTKDLIVFAILVVLVSFFLNLLVLGISKRKNRNDRTLKNINMQIKAFRNESSSTIERISTAGRECQQAVEAKVGEAEAMIKQVADSLDSLSQHHKDLAALEAVCVNYKAALEKLRISTEQAEARIQAVQAEVRKAESVNEFVESFQSDAERLTGEMQDLRSDYTRLVATTAEDLKSAAENQRNENQDMLQEFRATLGRCQTDFGDYVSSLRSEFESFAAEERQKADDAIIDTENRREDIIKSLEEGKASLDAYRGELEGNLAALEAKSRTLEGDADAAISSFVAAVDSRSEEARGAIDKAIDDMKARLEEFGRAEDEETERRKEILSQSLDEITSRLDSAIKEKGESFAALSDSISSAFTASMDEKKDAVEKAVGDLIAKLEADAEALRAETEGLRRIGEDAEENARRAIQEALQNAENARTALDSERNVFISSSCDALQKSFDSMIGDIDSRYQKIKEDGGAFIKNLADRVQDTRETIALLSEGEKEKISDAVDRLNELEGKIKLSEDQLTALSEQITRTREELFTAQQERGKPDSDIAERSKELDKMQSDMQSAKAQRINEEAALVRLKLQISNLQKAGSSKDESAKKKPEEMIAEFPDDIFTGNVEDVDLSDDDENE